MSVYELETFETPTQIAEDAYNAGHTCAVRGSCILTINDCPYETSNAYYVWQISFLYGWGDAKMAMGDNRDMMRSGADSHAA